MICIWGDNADYKLKENLIYEVGSVGHSFTRLKEVKEVKNVDILFLGASNCYHSFDTRIFKKAGYTSFNLGTNAQTPLQTSVLLNRYLEDLNPEIIIYAMAPVLLTIDGVESSLDIIANDKNDFESVKLAIKQNNMKVYNTLIYATYNDLLQRNKYFVEDSLHYDNRYITGGYEENRNTFSNPDNKIEVYNIPFKAQQIKCFQNNVSYIKKHGIRLFIVYPPNNSLNYKAYTKNVVFDSIINKNGEYYNFNKIIALDDSLHFCDQTHLNQFGTEIFNQKLIEILKTQPM